MHHTTVCALCEKLREVDWEKQTKSVCERKRWGRGGGGSERGRS